MARFAGMIGFALDKETRPGIFEEVFIERKYKGYVNRRSRNWEGTEYLNDALTIQNEITIVSDNFSNLHFGSMRYVRWLGQVFKIDSATIDLDQHQITISLGGIFNVPESSTDAEGPTP